MDLHGATEEWRRNTCQTAFTIWKDEDFDRIRGEICENCLSHMTTRRQELLQSFWDGLPTIFNMPGWVELEKLKAEALK